jgi:large subunit ribosomal protein L21
VYAIIQNAGYQFRAESGAILSLPKIEAEVGSTVDLGPVLLYADGKDLRIGKPTVEGVTVRGEVIDHGKTKKVIVFKLRKRENYRRTRGHRQNFTRVRVTEISAG